MPVVVRGLTYNACSCKRVNIQCMYALSSKRVIIRSSSTCTCRVQALTSDLSSLEGRLGQALEAAGEAQVVGVLEEDIGKLEVWLVSYGNFADNQHILEQIEDHKVTLTLRQVTNPSPVIGCKIIL